MEMKRKKVIINATNIGERSSGIGIYTLNIIKELVKKETDIYFEIYFNKKCRRQVSDILFPDNFEIKWVTKYVSPDYNFPGHFLRLIYSNLLSIFKKGNLFFNTSQLEISFFNRNQVVTIHDVIPLLFPELHKKQYFYFKKMLRFALDRTLTIITPSVHTKKLLIQFYGIHSDKIEMISNGIPDHFLVQRKNAVAKEDYIIYAGRICPMKNIKGIIDSFRSVKDSIPHNLVFIGGGRKEIKREIRAGRLPSDILNDKRIILKGYVSEDKMIELISHASLFIFPAFYEGFGLPPLEAMACGTPVLVSSASSIPEVCGNAAHYVDPFSKTQIANGILKIVKEKPYAEKLINRGFSRVENFPWSYTANAIMNILQYNLLNDPSPLLRRKVNFTAIGISKRIHYSNLRVKNYYSTE